MHRHLAVVLDGSLTAQWIFWNLATIPRQPSGPSEPRYNTQIGHDAAQAPRRGAGFGR